MEKIIKVRKANKIISVNENEVDRYLAIGYDIIDNKGNVVQATVPHDPNILRKAFIENEATINSLKQRISTLEAQISALKSQADVSIKQTTKQRNKRSSE